MGCLTQKKTLFESLLQELVAGSARLEKAG